MYFLLSHLIEFLLGDVSIVCVVLAFYGLAIGVYGFLIHDVRVIALTILVTVEIAQPINHHLKLFYPFLVLLILEEILLILIKLVFKVVCDFSHETGAETIYILSVKGLV